jgi:hypothetical protein
MQTTPTHTMHIINVCYWSDVFDYENRPYTSIILGSWYAANDFWQITSFLRLLSIKRTLVHTLVLIFYVCVCVLVTTICDKLCAYEGGGSTVHTHTRTLYTVYQLFFVAVCSFLLYLCITILPRSFSKLCAISQIHICD